MLCSGRRMLKLFRRLGGVSLFPFGDESLPLSDSRVRLVLSLRNRFAAVLSFFDGTCSGGATICGVGDAAAESSILMRRISSSISSCP